ncbi:MAG: hypothetical protein K0S80_3918 [Neobacillus sp.]|nr:hypothetical protein [Neobacillus sp.]
MAITTLGKVKTVLNISKENKDDAIIELIPLVEEWIKGYCNDTFTDGFPPDYESIAIEMIANDLTKLPKQGIQSESLGRYNVQYVAGVTAQRYPESITRHLRRKMRW